MIHPGERMASGAPGNTDSTIHPNKLTAAIFSDIVSAFESEKEKNDCHRDRRSPGWFRGFSLLPFCRLQYWLM